MNTLALAVSLTGTVLLVLCGAAAGLLVGAVLARRRVAVGGVGDSVEKATFRTLHTASLAAPPLRAGLTPDTARKAVRRLRPLLGSSALLLTDADRVLAWGGSGEHHTDEVMQHARDVLGSGRAWLSSPWTAPRRTARSARAWSCPSASTRTSAEPWPPSGPRSPTPWPGPRKRSPGGSPYSSNSPSSTGPAPLSSKQSSALCGLRSPPLHLQLARRDRVLRPHRPGTRSWTPTGVRGIHPLLLSAPRRLHHAGRRVALHRAIPGAGTRQVRHTS